MRNKLVENENIHHFSVISDFVKMGYKILAFSFVSFNMDTVMNNFIEVENLTKSWSESHPEIIFDSMAEGMEMDAVNISVHKNYSDYNVFLEQSKIVYGKFITEGNSILVDLEGGINKPFSFKYLAEKKET